MNRLFLLTVGLLWGWSGLTADEVSIKVIDPLQGRLLYSQHEKSPGGLLTTRLQLDHLPAGIYYVLVENGAMWRARKLVKL